MTSSADAGVRRRKLADAVSRRRAVLGYAMNKLPNGPTEVTLRSIEYGADETYRRKTLVNLDRSLGWKVGTSEGILNGTVEPPPEIDPTRTERALRKRLLDAGVGTRWDLPVLERHSRDFGQVYSYEWQSMVDDTFVWPDQKLRAAADTLSDLGEDVTPEQLKRANVADTRPPSGHIPPPVDDVQAAVKALIPWMTAADKVRAVQELARSLAADLPTDHPSETSHVRSTDGAPGR